MTGRSSGRGRRASQAPNEYVAGMFVLPAFAAFAGAAPAAPPLDLRVEGVVESCLVGEVDAAWVAALLAPEGLVFAGSAMVCGTDLEWSGTPFQEAVFVVATAPVGELGAGWFLVSALNSRPFFAWVERTKNRSPYWPGRIVIDPGDHYARITVGGRRAGIFEATSAGGEEVVRSDEGFRGPIHLPGRAWFAAEFSGDRESWAFRTVSSTFVVAPGGTEPFAVALERSAFQPREWSVREQAVHAKSGTQAVRP